jgi:predicted  nucleic acid-binding Zn-ribbon protein
MTNGSDLSNQQYVQNLVERTVVLERDLFHLDQSVTSMSSRISHLTARMQTAEYHLDHAITNIQRLEDVTEKINDSVPDLETAQRMMQWLLDALKYAIGTAIFLGVVTGKLSWSALEMLF